MYVATHVAQFDHLVNIREVTVRMFGVALTVNLKRMNCAMKCYLMCRLIIL
jgi:hypothetical protein